MRRSVAVLALVSFLAAGCGKTMMAAGGMVTMVGLAGMGIPDQNDHEGSGCDDGSGCVDVDFELQEGGVLLVGLALMGFGAIVNAFETRARDQAAPPPPPPSDPKGRWREVPPVAAR